MKRLGSKTPELVRFFILWSFRIFRSFENPFTGRRERRKTVNYVKLCHININKNTADRQQTNRQHANKRMKTDRQQADRHHQADTQTDRQTDSHTTIRQIPTAQHLATTNKQAQQTDKQTKRKTESKNISLTGECFAPHLCFLLKQSATGFDRSD